MAQNAAWALLTPNLRRHPHKTAYRCGDASLTYAGLADAVARAGACLAASGVQPGDRIVCVLPDGPSAAVALLGAMWIGACPVPLPTNLAPQDYAFIVDDAGAKLLVAEPDQAAASRTSARLLPAATLADPGPHATGDALPAHAPGPDDPALMLYTSGSTGRPKGVPHRHADILRPIETFGRVLGLTENDVLFSVSKMSFAYGLIASLTLALGHGATAVLFPDKPAPDGLFATIRRFRPSVVFAVPSVYGLLLRAMEPGDDLSGVRLFYSAGEALPPALFAAWRDRTGSPPCEGIGSTEAFNVFISNRPGQALAGTTGRLVPGYEARLVDEAGQDVPDGQPGALLIRGQGMASGYWNLPDKTRETMLPGGWTRTGDIFVAQGGVYVHQGRGDDMLKVAGRFVSPQVVENALLAHPEVAECAVSACRVDGLERPLAVVVAREGATTDVALAAALRRFARDRLPEEMCPARVEFVAALPKTPTGKIIRRALRRD
jgi:benzoate-CoA ligase